MSLNLILVGTLISLPPAEEKDMYSGVFLRTSYPLDLRIDNNLLYTDCFITLTDLKSHL